jgi:DNA-binding CsgD family transcriptional regulator
VDVTDVVGDVRPSPWGETYPHGAPAAAALGGAGRPDVVDVPRLLRLGQQSASLASHRVSHREDAAGEALLSPAITKRVIENFTRISHPEPPKGLDELTERELEVFRLIARGLSNAEIGQELYISDATVKTHITHILQKLNLRDRVQAVVLAHETRLFAADAQPASSRDERPAG